MTSARINDFKKKRCNESIYFVNKHLKGKIMAVPKRKTTPSKRKMRRSHLGLSSMNFVECPNCGELKLSHHICSSCGYYNKKSIVTMENLDENNELDSDN